jgi:hypothetical protein
MKKYVLDIEIYKRGEMNSRPLCNTIIVSAVSPAQAREIARSPKYSSLADVVKVKRFQRSRLRALYHAYGSSCVDEQDAALQIHLSHGFSPIFLCVDLFVPGLLNTCYGLTNRTGPFSPLGMGVHWA